MTTTKKNFTQINIKLATHAKLKLLADAKYTSMTRLIEYLVDQEINNNPDLQVKFSNSEIPTN